MILSQFEWTRKPDFNKIKFFDYDEYWKQFGVRVRDKLWEREDIFIDWIKPGSSVCDIACGNSPLLKSLKSKKKCTVKGIDVSGLIAGEQVRAGVPTIVKDIGSKNFSLDEKYDYIVLSEILEHLAYPELLINKLKTKAKYLVISIPNSAFYRFRLSLLFRGRFFTQWAWHPAEHIRFWSHIDFLDWLDAMELEVVEYRASNGLTLGSIKLFKKNINLFGFQVCYLVKIKT